MAFMMRKKRYKFQVELTLDELTEVVYSKAILLAKVRQLDGGSFTDVSDKMEVQNHSVKYEKTFSFPAKMTASANSGILEACKCRISIRMEERGGRHFRKIGFVDVNLAEYAGAGPSTQRYILQPYDSSHRLDNSIVQLSVNITLKEGDLIFQRPFTRKEPILLPGEESRRRSAIPKVSAVSVNDGNTASSTPPSSGSPLTTPALSLASSTAGSTVTVPPTASLTMPIPGLKDDKASDPASHTRNSSSTSQVSQGSGYGSQTSQPNAGVSGDKGHSRKSSSGGESSHGRNLSQGSADTGFCGSMEKQRRAIGAGRVDANDVIKELLEGFDLDKAPQDGDDDGQSTGLELFVAKDGTFTFDKNTSRPKDYERVVIEGPR